MKTQLPDLLPEISFKMSRSGGKGGQNVNKVETKVELSFDIAASTLLSSEQKELLLKKLESRLTKEGILLVVSQSERTQPGNKRVALEKFRELLSNALVVQKKRKKTGIPKAVKEKRLQAKKRHSELKHLRKNDF
jgi:ribosome-associated protein